MSSTTDMRENREDRDRVKAKSAGVRSLQRERKAERRRRNVNKRNLYHLSVLWFFRLSFSCCSLLLSFSLLFISTLLASSSLVLAHLTKHYDSTDDVCFDYEALLLSRDHQKREPTLEVNRSVERSRLSSSEQA